MKKALATAVAALMLMAFVPCALAADLTALTAESITADNEPASAVTKDLTLSPDYTWKSSDESVIKADGTVCRDILEDKNVTLTASDGTNTKTLKFTVLSRNSEVIYSDNFCYPEYAEQTVTNIDGWSYNDTAAGSAMQSKIKSDDSNYSFNMKRVINNTQDRIKYTFPENTGDKTTVRFRINATGGNFILRFDTNKSVNTSDIKFQLNADAKSYDAYYGNEKFVTSCPWATGWIDVELNFDFANSRVIVISRGYSSGGTLLTRDGQYEMTGTDSDTLLTQMIVMPYRNDAQNTEYNMDDFTVIRTIDYLSTLTDAERVRLAADKISAESLTEESLASVSKNLTLYSDNTIADVKWSSSNKDAVSDEGVVTVSEVSQPVTMTAEITSGEETAVKTFDLVVKEADTSAFYNLADDFEGSANSGWITPADSTLIYEASDKDSSTAAKFSTQQTGTKWLNFKTTANNGYTGNIRRYVAEADIKLIPNDSEDANSSTNYTFWLGGATPHAQFTVNTKGGWTSIRTYGDSTGSSTYKAVMSSPAANEWQHIKIDLNLYSQTYDYYVENEKIFSSEISDANIPGAASAPLRSLQFSIQNGGALCLDNVSVREYTDGASKTDAAIIRAKEYAQTPRADGETLLQTAGDAVYKKIVNGETVDNIFSNDASIAWTLSGEEKTAVESTGIGKVTYSVNASCGNSSAEAQVVLDTAPVRVVSLSETSAELLGALSGKKVVVAVYNGGVLGDVRIADAAGVTEYNALTVPEGAQIKAFVFNSLASLKPAGYVFVK